MLPPIARATLESVAVAVLPFPAIAVEVLSTEHAASPSSTLIVPSMPTQTLASAALATDGTAMTPTVAAATVTALTLTLTRRLLLKVSLFR